MNPPRRWCVILDVVLRARSILVVVLLLLPLLAPMLAGGGAVCAMGSSCPMARARHCAMQAHPCCQVAPAPRLLVASTPVMLPPLRWAVAVHRLPAVLPSDTGATASGPSRRVFHPPQA